MSDRVPFVVTQAAERYDSLQSLPVAILLDNIRSAYNVGAFFRTADAAGVSKLYLGGISAAPPHRGISKTALGAEARVSWERPDDSAALLERLRCAGTEIAAIETNVHAIDLFDWAPRFPVCVVFGNELTGITPALAAACDTYIRIPMLGIKYSLNVATAGG